VWTGYEIRIGVNHFLMTICVNLLEGMVSRLGMDPKWFKAALA
jgi:hypothetical protein